MREAIDNHKVKYRKQNRYRTAIYKGDLKYPVYGQKMITYNVIDSFKKHIVIIKVDDMPKYYEM